MPDLKIHLDDVQIAQLYAFASVNNMSIEQAAACLFTQSLNKKLDILVPPERNQELHKRRH